MESSLTRRADAPERSADQRREALANDVRMQRAALKARLKRGELALVTLIDDPPQYLVSARVAELLRALPTCGRVKVARLLECCEVSPRKTTPASMSASVVISSRRTTSRVVVRLAAES